MYGRPRGAILGDGISDCRRRTVLGRTILSDEIVRAISGAANIGNWIIVWAYVVDVFRLRDRLPHCGVSSATVVVIADSSVTVTGQ
jgi:hypothetical protein